MEDKSSQSSVDLSRAFQQIELEEGSRDYVTVNTMNGLFKYTRLPYGVASALAKCQQTMDIVLEGMDNVCCTM